MTTISVSNDNDNLKENKPDSSEKKPQRNSALEDIKRNGRQLRSAHKEGGWLEMYGGLTLEDFSNQPQGVGLVYDEGMLRHHCLWDPLFPEEPQRLSSPYLCCQNYGLIDRCKQIPARPALDHEVLMCHSPEWLNTMKQSADMSEAELKQLSSAYDGVFFHKTTYECSMLALGCTINLVDSVCNREVRHGMALVRPPGHHAMFDKACGYCFYNNVAVAAEHALRNHNMQRILIVDWDIHHGQGTQYAFYNDPRVLYFSIHRYEHGNFWPNLRQSDFDQIGELEGRGYNVNVPLNKTQMSNGDYFAIFTHVLLPIALEFNPQLVLVSAGFDSALGCPEGESAVTPSMFAHLVNILKTLANGKLALILEGGYCLKSLSESVALCLRALLGDPCPDVGPLSAPTDCMVSTILQVISVLRPYWRSLAFQGISEHEPELWAKHAPQGIIEFATEMNQPEKFEIVGDYILQPEDAKQKLDEAIDHLISHTSLVVAPNRTCLVYDEEMRAHKCTTIGMGSHPERPDRVRAIYDKHVECGLADRCNELQSRHATDDEILLVHTIEHLERVKHYADIELEDLHDMERTLNSVYLSKEAYQCASLATGSVLEAVDEVLTGKSQNATAIVRPPGHHAEPHVACGFCYFNTMAVAARYAQTKFNLQRILIVDWDIHHGNGTQHMFFSDPSILYISLHRYDCGFFFPTSEDGDFDKVGLGLGMGYNVNIPWNSKCGDAEYIAAFQQIVLPIAYEFGPELVLVSAGFDAAKGDPLGGFKVTPEGYAHMTHMLTGLANGHVIIGLEGGYNLNSISESMVMCTSMLLGDNCPLLPQPSAVPTERAVETIMNVINTQKEYWKSLRFGVSLPLTIEQKETLMAAGELAFKNLEMEGLTQGLECLSVTTEQTSDPAQSTPPCSEHQPETPEVPVKPPASGVSEAAVTAMNRSDTQKPSGSSQSEASSAVGTSSGSGDSVFRQAPRDGGGAEGHGSGGGAAGQDGVSPLPARGLNVSDPCMECGNVDENWVCLRCHEVHCGRFVNEHMMMHGVELEHRIVLSYSDLSAWCYACESYIHHQSLLQAKDAAHTSKFGYSSGVSRTTP